MATNRKIDSVVVNFALSNELHIDEAIAFEYLGKYLQELELLRAGVPYKELGMSQRRTEAIPYLLDPQCATLATDPYDFKYENSTPKNSIALMSLKGMMLLEGGASSYGIEDTIKWLDYAVKNKNIEGIIFNVRTGGGEARAGEALKMAIAEAVMKKPVVAWVDTMASAGVMAMLPVNEVVAISPRSKVGSIGTYMSIDMEFVNWYKDNVLDIYADDSPNKNLEFRQLLSGDTAGIKKMVNKTNKDFLSDVKAYRPLDGDDDTVKHTLSGAMFETAEAKKRGLVDSMGNLEYAVKRIQYYSSL